MPPREHQRPDAARRAPPYSDWRFMGFTDSSTNTRRQSVRLTGAIAGREKQPGGDQEQKHDDDSRWCAQSVQRQHNGDSNGRQHYCRVSHRET